MSKTISITCPVSFPGNFKMALIQSIVKIAYPDFSEVLYNQLLPERLRRPHLIPEELRQEDALLVSLCLSAACCPERILLKNSSPYRNSKECGRLLEILQKRGIEIHEF